MCVYVFKFLFSTLDSIVWITNYSMTMSINSIKYLLTYYFIVQMCFGIFISFFLGVRYYPTLFMIYMFTGVPVYFILYYSQISRLTNILKIYHSNILNRYGFKNPLTNQVNTVLPTILFKKNLNIKENYILSRIKLSKMCFILILIAFSSIPVFLSLSFTFIK